MILKKKHTVQVLKNINQFDGSLKEHKGLIPVVLIGVTSVGLYLLILHFYIPLILAIFILIGIIVKSILYFMLDEKKKYKEYLSKENSYSVGDLIDIVAITDDGIITYKDGQQVMLLEVNPRLYLDDDEFAEEIEAFLDTIPTTFDVYYIQEQLDDSFYESIKGLKVWENEDVKKERFDYYVAQAELYKIKCNSHKMILSLKVTNLNILKLQKFEDEINLNTETKKLFNGARFIKKISEIRKIISEDLTADVFEEDLLKVSKKAILKNNIIVMEEGNKKWKQ